MSYFLKGFGVKCLWSKISKENSEFYLGHKTENYMSSFISLLFAADVIVQPSFRIQQAFQQEKRQNVTHLCFFSPPSGLSQWEKVGECVCLVAYCQTKGNASLHFEAGS